MQNILLSLIVNIMMAVLLLVTIMYCWRLNTRIKLIQDSRSELARIIREFDESTKRATESIGEIHEATRRISENMQHKIDKANFLADDLQYMIEKGNAVANKIDPMASPRQMPRAAVEPIRPGRSATAGAAAVGGKSEMEAAHNVNIVNESVVPGPAPRRAPHVRSRSEQELMSILKTKDESGR